MQCFATVSVAFPANASVCHPREAWSSTPWIDWCTGELRIDRTSLIMVFSPGGCGALTAKPLGCLLSAAATENPAGHSGQPAFVASTNDSVHSIIRFTFAHADDAVAFAAIAQSAETSSMILCQGSGSRRSTMAAGRRSSIAGCFRDDVAWETLHAHLSQQFPGQLPVVFGGSELFGPDPHGDIGSEVLLGRGAVVLVDPNNGCRVGAYELFFYEEGNQQPCLRLPVGPRTRLIRQPDDTLGGSDRLSLASHRPSFCGSDGKGAYRATAYTLLCPGVSGWTLAFDSENEAASFERDFSVRQRLVALSLKTSQGWRFADSLHGELMDLRRSGLLLMLRQLLQRALVLVILLIFLYAAMLFSSSPNKSLADVTAQTLNDAVAVAQFFVGRAAEAGTMTCGVFTEAISASEVRRCADLPFAEDAQTCIARLVSAPL